MKYKDYYKILGLSGPKATDNEVKSAYRKLAKMYHPDINPGNLQIAERFKDINEAYQVLTDEDKRKKYNMKHFAYSFKGVLDIKNLKNRIDSGGATEFVEMFVGKTIKKNQNVKSSKKNNSKFTGEDIEIQINITLEEAFNGVSKKISFKSFDDKTKNITVKVPCGIVNGGKIRIKGQGKPGKNGGTFGDLFIKINILENIRYKLEKSNLLMELLLTPSEAALGCELEVEAIDSKEKVNIHSGMQSGESIHICGKGYFDENGKRGDLVLRTRIVVPNEISEKERELYKTLQEISKFMPRKIDVNIKK